MTKFVIKYISKNGIPTTLHTEKNSVRSVWTQAKTLTGNQFYTATVEIA